MAWLYKKKSTFFFFFSEQYEKESCTVGRLQLELAKNLKKL